MPYTYLWNQVTSEGVFLDEQAKSTNVALLTLINNLRSNYMEITAMSQEGVVIDHIDDRVRDRIDEINRQLDIMREQISHLDVGWVNHDTKIAVLESYNSTKINPITEIPPEKDETGEVLYIMWDLIPDELKKKLTIYIKKL